MSDKPPVHRAVWWWRIPRGAFTLVELLVVVSIIALLISILLPSLKKAREQAKSATCLADLRSVSTASLVYAADDRTEAAVPVHPNLLSPAMADDLRRAVAAHSWGGKSGRGKEGTDVLFWGTGRSMGPAHRPLNKFLYKSGFVDYKSNPGPGAVNWKNDEKLNLEQFHCPSDKGYQGIHWMSWKASKLTSYDHYGNSYAANILWIFVPGADNCPPPASGSCCWSNSPALRPLSRIPSASNTLYYEENVGRYAFFAAPNGTVTPCGDIIPGVVRGWHGRDWTFNASFADAHAATVRMQGYANPHLPSYPERDYTYWHCVIIRGNGFQRDTLPSPPVFTDIPCSTARDSVD